MEPKDFCYWLKGYFESENTIDPKLIQTTLQSVFSKVTHNDKNWISGSGYKDINNKKDKLAKPPIILLDGYASEYCSNINNQTNKPAESSTVSLSIHTC